MQVSDTLSKDAIGLTIFSARPAVVLICYVGVPRCSYKPCSVVTEPKLSYIYQQTGLSGSPQLSLFVYFKNVNNLSIK
jgi:hypothetical protein